MRINNKKVITVTSAKGGVGKSIFASMLAYAYASIGKKVLLIDFDLYSGNLGFLFTTKSENTIFNLSFDMASNSYKSELLANYVEQIDENLFLLSAPKDPRQANKIPDSQIWIILNNLMFSFDVIVVDTNHIFTSQNTTLFDSSHRILNVTSNDPLDLQSTRNFTAILANMSKNNGLIVLNESLDKGKALFSSYDIRNIIKKDISYKIPACFNIRKIDAEIMNNSFYKVLTKTLIKNNKELYNLQNFAKSLLIEEIEDEKEE